MRSSIRRARSGFAAVLALALVAGCSVWSRSTTTELVPPAFNAPGLPTPVFAPLTDRGKDVVANVNGLASDGKTVVATGNYQGNVNVPLFRWSTDSGATWHDGELGPRAGLSSGIGDSSLGMAAVSGGTWLAMGESRGKIVVWLSDDAKVWELAAPTGLENARIGELVATSYGWVLVGAKVGPDGRNVPHAWTSTDGIAWTTVVVTKTPGTLRDVARRGTSLVAVGAHPLEPPNSDGSIEVPATYLSVDEGKTWRQVKVPEPVSSNRFATYLTEVTATPSAFVAAGGYNRNGSYRNFIVTSTDGVTWTPMPSVESNLNRSWIRDLIVVNDQPMLITGDMNTSGSETEIHIFTFNPAKKDWVRVDLPEPINKSTLSEALGVGSTALLALTWDDQTRRSVMFRSTTQGARWQRQDQEVPTSVTPRVAPSGFVIANDSPEGTDLVFGDAQGAGVVWEKTGSGYGPPRVVLDPAHRAIDGMVASPTSLLMWGVKDGEAWAAVSTDAGQTWTYTGDQQFNRVTSYSWSRINSAAWVKDRWVVVGQRTTNGSARESAFTASSTDGITWRWGVPTTSKTLAPDGFAEDPVVSDLSGVLQQQRGMEAVVAVGAEAVAVGWTADNDASRPAWWSSTGQGHQWRLHNLPMKGMARAAAANAVVIGSKSVITGWAKPKPDSPDWQPCRWTSADGGKTWTFTTETSWGTTASSVDLAVHQQEVLAIVQSKDLATVTLWRSADVGATWTKQPLQLADPGAGSENEVVSVAVKGDTLLILTRVRNRLDAVTVVNEVPLK